MYATALPNRPAAGFASAIACSVQCASTKARPGWHRFEAGHIRRAAQASCLVRAHGAPARDRTTPRLEPSLMRHAGPPSRVGRRTGSNTSGLQPVFQVDSHVLRLRKPSLLLSGRFGRARITFRDAARRAGARRPPLPLRRHGRHANRADGGRVQQSTAAGDVKGPRVLGQPAADALPRGSRSADRLVCRANPTVSPGPAGRRRSQPQRPAGRESPVRRRCSHPPLDGRLPVRRRAFHPLGPRRGPFHRVIRGLPSP